MINSNFWQIGVERILKHFEIKIILLFYLVENNAVNVPRKNQLDKSYNSFCVFSTFVKIWYLLAESSKLNLHKIVTFTHHVIPVKLPFLATWPLSPMFVLELTKPIHASSKQFSKQVRFLKYSDLFIGLLSKKSIFQLSSLFIF